MAGTPDISFSSVPGQPHQTGSHEAPGKPGSDTGRMGVLPALKTCIWYVTNACNLHCLHCLNSSGEKQENELTTQQALQVIDQLSDAGVSCLSLSGGEPLLRKDIPILLQHLATKNIRIDIATNGTVMNKHLLACLQETPVFQVQVSIDGTGDQHDRFRGKKGTFRTACKTIGKLRDQGMTVSLSTTVTAQNAGQLETVIELALTLDCQGIKIIPFLPAGRGQEHAQSLLLNAEDRLRLSRIIDKKRMELKDRLEIFTEVDFSFLLRQPTGKTGNGPMFCSAGHDSISIDPDGTVYPCPFLRDFPLGKLPSDTLQEIWNQAPLLATLRALEKQEMKDPCRTCPLAPLVCQGGCRAAAYLLSGDLSAPDPGCFRHLMDTRVAD